MSIFKPSQNTFPPFVNDNEQGPSGGGGLRKIDNIFIERKDDILLACKQIFNC